MLTRYQPADTKSWCMQCGEASPLSVQATISRSPAAMGQFHLDRRSSTSSGFNYRALRTIQFARRG
jgi:hypothetical protein